MAASAAYAGFSAVFLLAAMSRGCMAYLDSLRQSLDLNPSTVDLFLDRDMLYAHARLLWALCMQWGAAEQGPVTEGLEHSAPHELEALGERTSNPPTCGLIQ